MQFTEIPDMGSVITPAVNSQGIPINPTWESVSAPAYIAQQVLNPPIVPGIENSPFQVPQILLGLAGAFFIYHVLKG